MREFRYVLGLSLAYFLGGLTMALMARPELVRSTLRAVRIGWHGGWPPLRLVDWQSWPKEVRRIWPPPHAGGQPSVSAYDWAFELTKREGLTDEEAWQQYMARYGMKSDNSLLVKNNRRSFMQAMRRRREVRN
jgi:hypothetical protein